LEKKRFDRIEDDVLFWMSKTDAPETPHDFYGPFKKKIYLEFHKNAKAPMESSHCAITSLTTPHAFPEGRKEL
jgi:hypothetical protein